MKIHELLGAAFLLVGTVGAVSIFRVSTDTYEREGAHVYKFVKPTRFGSSP